MNDKFILVLVFCTIIISFVFWNIIQAYSWDEVIYLSMAKGLLEGKGYGWIGNYNNMYRAPAITYFYYIFFLLFGVSEAISKLAILLISLVSIYLIYFLGRIAINHRFGLLAALALFTNHLFIFFSHRLLPEILLSFFQIASVLCFWLSLKDKRYLILVSIFTGLAFLTRYTALIIVIPFFIYLVFLERKMQRISFL